MQETYLATTRQSLSELEAFVLGLIWQFGPISPYDIRRHMQRSPSTQWSASTGAIYPLVAKLETLRLIAAGAANKDPRGKRIYKVTPAGKAALKSWIGPPLSADAITVTYDPLRTRVRFLSVLTCAKQKAWFAAARAGLDEVERRVLEWEELYSRPTQAQSFAGMLTRNGQLELAARRKWIEEVAALVEKPGR